MKTTTLGMLAILVLFAGMLAHPLSDAFAVQTKKPLSSTEKNMEDQKIKDAEKRDTETQISTTTDTAKPEKKVISSADLKAENDKITNAERYQGAMTTGDNKTSDITKPVKTPVSSADMKAANDKIKEAEKKSSDNSAQAKEKSVSKNMVSTKHRQTTIKKQRLAAGIKH